MDEGEPHVVTTEWAFAGTARSASPGARVPVEIRAAVEDPFHAYRRARDDTPSADSEPPEAADGIYLETTGGQSGWSVVMGVCNRTRPHEGVQFHPESILTPVGMGTIEAFVRGCRDGE